MGNGERPGRLLGKPETLFARGGIQRMLASLKIVKQLIGFSQTRSVYFHNLLVITFKIQNK